MKRACPRNDWHSPHLAAILPGDPPFYSNTGRVCSLFPSNCFSWMPAAKLGRSQACSGPVISMSLRHKPATRSGRRMPLGRVVNLQIPRFVSAWNSFCSQVLKASLRLLSERRVRHNFELNCHFSIVCHFFKSVCMEVEACDGGVAVALD